ncbi:MAG: single-stranded DNA-binding protein, partial [Acidobacteriota bacterium]
LATNERKKDKSGEMQDVTTWFKVTLWRQQAEVAAKYLTKGKQVYIEGRLRLEDWTDRDGNTRQSLEVTATDMQFIGARGDDSHSNAPSEGDFAPRESSTRAASASSPTPAPASADDDIPF